MDMDEVVVDTTDFTGSRVYAEVSSKGAGGAIRLYAEGDADGVELLLTPLEALDLLNALSRAVTAAIA